MARINLRRGEKKKKIQPNNKRRLRASPEVKPVCSILFLRRRADDYRRRKSTILTINLSFLMVMNRQKTGVDWPASTPARPLVCFRERRGRGVMAFVTFPKSQAGADAPLVCVLLEWRRGVRCSRSLNEPTGAELRAPWDGGLWNLCSICSLVSLEHDQNLSLCTRTRWHR